MEALADTAVASLSPPAPPSFFFLCAVGCFPAYLRRSHAPLAAVLSSVAAGAACAWVQPDRKDSFRRYLESHRVLDVLTNTLTDLFEMVRATPAGRL